MGRETAAYWWWDTGDGTRALVLTETQLGISGELDRTQLAGLEDARRRGCPLDADLGRHGLVVELDQVVELRLARDEAQLELMMVDGVTSIGLRPPDWSIAAGLFEELRRRRAPTSPVRATMVNPGPEAQPGWWARVATTSFMATTGGLGALLCIFAAMEPGTDSGDAARDGVRSLIGSVFGTVGFVPALLCFVVTLIVAISRLVAERAQVRRVREVRHEIRVAVPEHGPEPVVAAEPPPDAISFSARPDGADPLADLIGDTAPG
ncbi:MAG: hypothetical protein ACE367_19390 [Acidimicrobiales bacterium]